MPKAWASNRRNGRRPTQISFILLVVVGLVLLVTCTNVANLCLARATSRRTEVGIRMALGAGRSRIVRQLVTESSLLAASATLLALPVVYLAGDVLPMVFPFSVSVSMEADGRVYAFLVGIGVLAGLLFGAAPAWSSSRRDVNDALREGASTGGRSKTRLRDALVVAQLGLSLGLVSYGASQRIREIGIRIALGARPESLVRLILGKGVAIAVLGVGFGFAIAYGLGLALQSLLFRVGHTDLPTLAAAAAVLLTAAGIAAWLPARRASRVDAAVSLRDG